MKKENKTKIDSSVHNEHQFNLDKQFLNNPVYIDTDSRDRKRSIYKLIYFLFCAVLAALLSAISFYFLYPKFLKTHATIDLFGCIISTIPLGLGSIIYLRLVIKSVKDLIK
jgi:hypothetical protein